MKTFRRESSNPKWNAQRNLSGITHYVDDDTLRFWKARVLSSHVIANGLLFSLVESVALDMSNTKRGYRYAIFDLFGTCIDRPDLASAFSSSKAATAAMWEAIEKIDATAHTLAAIKRAKEYHMKEMDDMAAAVLRLIPFSPRP